LTTKNKALIKYIYCTTEIFQRTLKRQKEKEKQLRILLETKEIIDTTDEKYTKIEQYTPTQTEGLTTSQIEKRQAEGLTNLVKNKYSKSYAQILCGNLFTFFNLLCVLCVIALSLVKDSNFTDFLFVIVYVINLTIGIIQEIRSKITVEKLSLVKVPMSKVVRNGVQIEIQTKDLVLNDVVLLTTGNQIPCDSVVISGEADVNESLLTGESVAVKKSVGDKVYAGTYIGCWRRRKSLHLPASLLLQMPAMMRFCCRDALLSARLPAVLFLCSFSEAVLRLLFVHLL